MMTTREIIENLKLMKQIKEDDEITPETIDNAIEALEFLDKSGMLTKEKVNMQPGFISSGKIRRDMEGENK